MLTKAEAAARLSVRESEVADAGEKHGLPWAKAKGGAEYVWVDGLLHILWKPQTETERIEKRETSYAGLAIPRWIPPAIEGEEAEEVAEAIDTLKEAGLHTDDLVDDLDAPPDDDPADDDPPVVDLDAMTKGELAEHAVSIGLTVPAKANKAAIRKLIDDAS